MTREQRFACQCCGYLTLSEPGMGSYEICEVCFWEDDPVQNRDPSFWGGANKPSLHDARRNYRAFGACEARLIEFVRPPRPEEYPPPSRPDLPHSPDSNARPPASAGPKRQPLMAPDDPNAVPSAPSAPDDEEEEDFEMEVRELEPEELVSAAEMLTRAFAGSPLMQVLAPDEATRPDICRWFFEAEVTYALLYGDAFAAVEDDGTVQGAALWWAPENVEPDDDRASESGLADGLAVVGPENWERLQTMSRAMQTLHRQIAPEPHWYLSIIGVEPELHGQGIGGEILAASLDMVDEEGYPAYLETAVERNLAIYQKYGFVVGGEVAVPSLAITLWGLRREAQA